MNITEIINKGIELGYTFRDEESHEIYVDPDTGDIYANLHAEEVALVDRGPWRPRIKTEFKMFPAKYVDNADIKPMEDGSIKVTAPNAKRSITLKIEISRTVHSKDELNKILSEINAS